MIQQSNIMTKCIKIILTDIRSSIVSIIVTLFLSGSIAGSFGFLGDYATNLLTTKIYLWQMLALSSLFYLLGFLINKKKNKSQNIDIEYGRQLVAKWRKVLSINKGINWVSVLRG